MARRLIFASQLIEQAAADAPAPLADRIRALAHNLESLAAELAGHQGIELDRTALQDRLAGAAAELLKGLDPQARPTGPSD